MLRAKLKKVTENRLFCPGYGIPNPKGFNNLTIISNLLRFLSDEPILPCGGFHWGGSATNVMGLHRLDLQNTGQKKII